MVKNSKFLSRLIFVFAFVFFSLVCGVLSLTACEKNSDDENDVEQEMIIEKVEIVCGDIIVYYENGTSKTIGSVYPEAGHNYNDGEITTKATCVTPGVITYTCSDCGAKYAKILDSVSSNHIFSDYIYNETSHWHTCNLCGYTEEDNHDFGDVSKDSNPETKLDCLCGLSSTVGQLYSFKVTFICGEGASVKIYNTQDYTLDGTTTSVAYARDSTTGQLINDGNGQVNFEIVLKSGYALDNVSASPSSSYNNLKGKVSTDNELIYRFTKITGELIVTITTNKASKIENFASYANSDGEINFYWQSDANLENVVVEVSQSELNYQSTVTLSPDVTSYCFKNANSDTKYDFSFTPYSYNGTAGESITCSRYIYSKLSEVNIPKIEITTADYLLSSCSYVSAPTGFSGAGIADNNYVVCSVDLLSGDNTTLYSSQKNGADGAKIKIRGNTSAYTEKQSYKIKLDKKSDLLANLISGRDDGVSYADKEWLLLNLASSIKNTLGWGLSDLLDMSYTPAYTYVAVTVNGDYRGIYMLCESVKQGNGTGDTQSRCQVDDDGYVVECDAYWWNEDLYFATTITQVSTWRYTFKYPDSDDITASSESYLYIQNYINEFEAALLKDDDSYLDYIDVESFAKWILAHNLGANIDGAGSNIFITKKDSTSDSKLTMGPLWDFDGWFSASTSSNAIICSWYDYYFYYLLRKESFKTVYNELFEKIQANIVSYLNDVIDNNINEEAYNKLIDAENLRWGTSNSYLADQKTQYINWLTEHIAWLAETI